MKNKTLKKIRENFGGYFLGSLVFGFPIYALISTYVSFKCQSYKFEHTKSTIEGVVIEEKYFAERHSHGNAKSGMSSSIVKIYSIDVKLPDGTIQSFDYYWDNGGKEIDSLIKKNDTIKFKNGYRLYEELTGRF